MPWATYTDDVKELTAILEALERLKKKRPIHDQLIEEIRRILEELKGGESHERLSRKADRGVP